MPEYESSTHLTRSDRMFIYLMFLTLLGLTVVLYAKGVDGFSRLSLYVTVLAFLPVIWALAAGHYDRKYRRLAREHAQCVPARRLRAVADLPEPTYRHKGETVPLGEALGVHI